MTTINAIYKNGIFQPIGHVELADESRVRLQIEPISDGSSSSDGLDAIYEIMARRFKSGRHDLAQRHNEHQP